MKQITQCFAGLLATTLLWAPRAMAYNNWGTDIKMFSSYDLFFDILSFSVALVAFGFGMQMLHRFSEGLKKAWRYCMVIIALFVILQILTVISLFYSFELSGLFSMIKLLMAIFLLVTVISTRSFIKKILKNKILNNRKNNELSESQ